MAFGMAPAGGAAFVLGGAGCWQVPRSRIFQRPLPCASSPARVKAAEGLPRGRWPGGPSLVACAAAARAATKDKRRTASRRKSRTSRPTLAQLREKLKELGLPSSGRKGELLESLRLAVLEAEEEDLEVAEELAESKTSRGKGVVQDVVSASPAAGDEEGHDSEDGDPDLVRPGDRIFLRAHSGRCLDVEHESVQARWEDTGDWQALVIEKNPLVVERTDAEAFQTGDLAFFRARSGCYLDVENDGAPVRARWQDLGVWQGLEVTKRGAGAIRAGDTIFLKAHTGLFIDVQRESVQARWADEGDWQALVIEK